VQALLRAAGIEGATSHSLRRWHANTLRRQGVDLVVIQGQLGHSLLATTAVYMGASECGALGRGSQGEVLKRLWRNTDEQAVSRAPDWGRCTITCHNALNEAAF